MALLPPLAPNFEAALRDVRAKGMEFRLAAAVVLGEPHRGREDEALEALGTLTRDASARVRAAALDSLGRIGHEDFLPEVLAGLEDRSPAVREMAMSAAAGIGGERGWAAVREGLAADHPEVRFQALCALARHPPSDDLPDVEPDVAALLRDDDPEVAAEAATTLAALGAEGFAGALAAQLDDGPLPVRDACALALAHLQDARAVPHLRSMLRARRAPFDAVLALGDLGASEAADEIASVGGGLFVPLLLKAAAGTALVAIDDARGVQLLGAVLRAFRSDGRSFAVEQVGRRRVEALLPELLALAARPRGVDPVTQLEALGAFAEAHEPARAALARLERAPQAAGTITP
jgi:HEAT repeat protein